MEKRVIPAGKNEYIFETFDSTTIWYTGPCWFPRDTLPTGTSRMDGQYRRNHSLAQRKTHLTVELTLEPIDRLAFVTHTRGQPLIHTQMLILALSAKPKPVIT